MKLHQNKELFQDAVLSASQRFGIPEIYVEKDYWVTLVLYEIFHSNIADQIVFKGGTSLSKCHKLIQRFSEDIDLVVLRNEGENENQLKRKIRSISKVVENVLREIQVEGLTNKKGNIRKTVHRYNRLFEGSFGQAREQIILEPKLSGFLLDLRRSLAHKGFAKILDISTGMPAVFANPYASRSQHISSQKIAQLRLKLPGLEIMNRSQVKK